MPRRRASAPLTLTAPDPVPAPRAVRLPLDVARGVRVTLEGSDIAAVEAIAAELKARFGTRFAVTSRRLAVGREALRISGGLIANPDGVLDAEGIRQWALPEAWRSQLAHGRLSDAADRGMVAAGQPGQVAPSPDGHDGDRHGSEGEGPRHRR